MYFPLEIWVLIASYIDDHKDWYNLIVSVCEFGLYSLNSDIQRDAKDKFTRKEDGGSVIEYKLPDGTLHRGFGKSAKTTLFTNGNSLEEWFVNGNRYRSTLPAFIRRDKDGNILSEKWYTSDSKNIGKIHRPSKEGPAHKIYGNKKTDIWYFFGKMHRSREEGPAKIKYKNSWAEEKEWHECDQIIKNRPYIVKYDYRGETVGEVWIIDNNHTKTIGYDHGTKYIIFKEGKCVQKKVVYSNDKIYKKSIYDKNKSVSKIYFEDGSVKAIILKKIDTKNSFHTMFYHISEGGGKRYEEWKQKPTYGRRRLHRPYHEGPMSIEYYSASEGAGKKREAWVIIIDIIT